MGACVRVCVRACVSECMSASVPCAVPICGIPALCWLACVCRAGGAVPYRVHQNKLLCVGAFFDMFYERFSPIDLNTTTHLGWSYACLSNGVGLCVCGMAGLHDCSACAHGGIACAPAHVRLWPLPPLDSRQMIPSLTLVLAPCNYRITQHENTFASHVVCTCVCTYRYVQCMVAPPPRLVPGSFCA